MKRKLERNCCWGMAESVFSRDPNDRFLQAQGFTLVELVVVAAVFGVLVLLAIPAFKDYKQAARAVRAAEEIRGLEKSVYAFFADNGRLPTKLEEMGLADFRDPWGKKYEYHLVTEADYHPYEDILGNINSDFDLFSPGADGASDQSLFGTPMPINCEDDIVRIGDGSYVGLGKGFR